MGSTISILFAHGKHSLNDVTVAGGHIGRTDDPSQSESYADILTRHGLGEVGAAGATDVTVANDLYRLTFKALRRLNASVGATEADLDRIDAVLASPDVIITGVTVVTVRGRKPK